MKYEMYGGKIVPTESKILSEARKTGFIARQISVNLGFSPHWLSKRLSKDASLRKKYNSARDQHFIKLGKRVLREAEKTGFNAVQVSLNLGWSREWLSKLLERDASLRKKYKAARDRHFIELERRALREAEKAEFNVLEASLSLGEGRCWISNRLHNFPAFRLAYNQAKEEYDARYA